MRDGSNSLNDDKSTKEKISTTPANDDNNPLNGNGPTNEKICMAPARDGSNAFAKLDEQMKRTLGSTMPPVIGNMFSIDVESYVWHILSARAFCI